MLLYIGFRKYKKAVVILEVVSQQFSFSDFSLALLRRYESVTALPESPSATKSHTPFVIHQPRLVFQMTLGRPMSQFHCVRCHQTYTRLDNASADPATMTCIVDHIWGQANVLPASKNLSATETRYLRPALCCPNVYREETQSSAGVSFVQPCFEGKHTTNPTAVKYNNVSMKPCTVAHSQ